MPVLIAITLALGTAVPQRAAALVLDWQTASWTAGTTSNQYDLNGDSLTDIRVAFGGSVGEISTDPINNLPTPAINGNLEGGQGAGNLSLNLAMDLGKQDRTVTVNVFFNGGSAPGAENVSFSIFGIDKPGAGTEYIDQIRSIVGIGLDGVTTVLPTISGLGSSITASGSGLALELTGNNSVARTGAGSDAGNVTITFSAPIQSFTFAFGDDEPAFNNPLKQDISIGDINFTPVPEVNPTLAAAGVCTVGLLIVARRRASRRAV